MVVAEVFHSTFSVHRRLFVDGPVTRDKQAAPLVVERLPCWPCKYVARPVLCAPSLKNSRVSFLACWFCVNVPWERIKFPPRNTFVPRLASCFLELTSSVQRAALREAWGALSIGDPLSSPLAHYENMLSLMGTSHTLENADK
jgi:hypothetical protein